MSGVVLFLLILLGCAVGVIANIYSAPRAPSVEEQREKQKMYDKLFELYEEQEKYRDG